MSHPYFPSPSKCYGREEEVSTLRDAYRRVCGCSDNINSALVLVSGDSGSGKTALVQTLRGPVAESGGYFITGKFDQHQRSKPYSALVAAYSEFCDLVLAEGRDKICGMKDTILDVVGYGGKLLTDLIPSLEGIIGEQKVVANRSSEMESQANSFNNMFRNLTRAISSPTHPLVLFLDDLQWGDASSLDLIANLVADEKSTSVLFVLTYRDNEVSETHPVVNMLGKLECDNIAPTTIDITNLSRENVNEMISDGLGVNPASTCSLAETVFQRTHGNVLFTIQYLKALSDNDLLYYDNEESRWRWDVELIRLAKISDCEVELLAKKIQKLPDRSQDIFKVAACTGAEIDEKMLELVMNCQFDQGERQTKSTETSEDLARILAQGVCDQLLIDPAECGKYRFAHGRVQQAAYSLIPETDREEFHLKLGRFLRSRSSSADLEDWLFIIVSQLNQGSTLIEDRGEIIDLARLNLKAGEKAMLLSAFSPASTYLRKGIGFLCERRCWRDNYDLTYALFITAAEAEYCKGNFDIVERNLDQVLRNATSFNDMIPAYATLVYALGAQNKVQEALDTGFKVLGQLGERFPPRPLKVQLAIDLYRTKRMIGRRSNSSLLGLPQMVRPDTLATIQLINVVTPYAYVGKPAVVPLLIFRLVQLSLRHGACALSSLAFAAYGFALCGGLDQRDEAHRFGQLALLFLEKFDAKEWLARVYAIVHGTINIWSGHIKQSLEPLQYGCRVGLETGDIEYSMVNARIFCLHSFQCGRPLPEVERAMRNTCQQMARHRQTLQLLMTAPHWQTALNFMGKANDPLILTGEAMDEEEVLNDHEKKNDALCAVIHLQLLTLAYFFGKYELATEMARKSRNMPIGRYEICTQSFLDGLSALAVAQKSKQRKWEVISRKNLRRMKEWAKHAPENCLHRVYLLEAETLAMKGKYDEAVHRYAQSAHQAGKEGFIQERALACERAGMYHLKCGDESSAYEYLKQACTLYGRWGAVAKVAHMERKYSFL